MTTTLTRMTLLIVFLWGGLSPAQNASSYYRKIASEQRKIRTKQINFYKITLTFTDAKRIEKGRQMVLTQILSSQRNLSRTPAFRGDSVLRNDYVRVLEIYHKAYTDAWDSIQKCKAVMGDSEKAMKDYLEAYYIMDDMIAEAEERWLANEEYFTGSYNVRPMVDPSLAALNVYRSLGVYVEDIRATYSTIPFEVKAMKDEVRAGNFDLMEDGRIELALAAEDAMIALTSVGNYIYIDPEDETADEEEDDYLYEQAIGYLEYIKDAMDGDFAETLTDLDDAIYDGDEKKMDKYKAKLVGVLDDLIAAEADMNASISDFVNDYIEQ